MASKKRRSLSIAELRESVKEASAFVEKNQKDSALCVGYLWATLAGLLLKCGDPRPAAPWEKP